MSERVRKERLGARRWMAVGAATAIQFFSYLLVIFGFAAASEDETTFAGGVLGIGFGLVPAAMFCLSVVSQHERSIRAGFLATGLWIVVGGPIAVVDLPAGLVAGFGAGGVVALRRNPPDTTVSRAVGVGACVAYVFVLGRLIPEAALMVGSVLPFAAVGVADSIMEREAAAAEQDAEAEAAGVRHPSE